MALEDQNPFSAYSPEDQQHILGQLRTLHSSGQLSPVQSQGVSRAIGFLDPTLQSKMDLIQRKNLLSTHRVAAFPENQPEQMEPTYDIMTGMQTGQADAGPKGKALAEQQSAIPQAVMPALGVAKKIFVDPFNKLAAKGSKALADKAEQIVTPAINPERPGTSDPEDPEYYSEENKAYLKEKENLDWANITLNRQNHPAATGIARGLGGVVGGAVADPRYWPLLGAGGATGKALQVGFGTQMAIGAVDQSKELGRVINDPSVSTMEKVEMGTSMIASTLMAAHAGSGIARPMKPLVTWEKPSTPETAVTSAAQAKLETDYFQVAKAEWQQKNPGVDPGSKLSNFSEIGKRAQELKDQAKDDPVRAFSEDALKKAREAEAPKSLPTTQNPSVVLPPLDLRQVPSDERHDFINKNIHLKLNASTTEGAKSQASEIFGPTPHEVLSYIDKDGKTNFGVRMIDQGEGKSLPQSPGPASPQEGQPFSEREQKIYSQIQTLEGDFNERTQGAHTKLISELYDHAAKNLPEGSSREAKLFLYQEGLRQLTKATAMGDLDGMMKSFDTAARRGEKGAINPRPPLTTTQVEALTKAHVDTQLTKWEQYPDPVLVRGKVLDKLTDPSFKNAVYNANDPALEARFETLMDRTGAARASDPIAALGRTLSNQSLTPGDLSRGVMRESLAKGAHSKAIQEKALQGYVDDWNKRPLSDSIDFIDHIEQGEIANIADPKDRNIARILRSQLDAKRTAIQALGTGKLDNFYDNYFPHMWKFGVTDMARQLMTGKRPLSGGAGFLRQRTYTSFAEGIANGLEPVTYNPVQLALLKMHEMDRYLTAHQAFNALKDKGLVHQFTLKDAPEGWVRLNDSMFQPKPFVAQGAVVTDPASLGFSRAWYAPADAAKPINNYLSPGLKGNSIFNSINSYNNLINQFNLGLSAFHGVETGVNAAVSQFAIGLGKLSRGDVVGALKGVKGFIEPVAAVLRGNRLLQEYLEPGRFSKMSRLALALDEAGGRASIPSEYKNMAAQSMRNAWKEAMAAPNLSLKQMGKLGLTAYRGIGAVMEKVSWPIMEYYVPRVKLGVFADMAADTIQRLGPNAPKEIVRAELGKVWDSIDNRFGQVVYDNLFWNRTAKDLAHISIRSVGWNMGTFRELGGAAKDTLTLHVPGNKGGLTTRQTYTLALLGTTMMMGAVIGYAHNQPPKEMVDYLYPKTGKVGPDGSPERIYLKTYIHDAYSFSHAPGQTAVNKLAPVWHQIAELYSNADYYGNQIHPVHGSTGEAVTDPKTYLGVAKYIASSSAPFSITNYQQRRAGGESIAQSVTSTAAILPAPKWVGQSPAQSLAYELYRPKLARGPNDPDLSARIQRYHQLASGYAAQQFTVQDVKAAYQKGDITLKQFDGILDEKEGNIPPIARHTKQLNPGEFIRVWDIASPDERGALQEQFLHKLDSISDKYPPKEAETLTKHYQESWKQSKR